MQILGIKLRQVLLFFGKIDRSLGNMEMYKWKWKQNLANKGT